MPKPFLDEMEDYFDHTPKGHLVVIHCRVLLTSACARLYKNMRQEGYTESHSRKMIALFIKELGLAYTPIRRKP